MSLKQVLAGMALAPTMAIERIVRSSKLRTPIEEAQSILILEYMLPLGCCVHLTPLYDAIRAEKPHAVIIVATRGIALELLRHNTAIDHLIETPDPLRNLFAAAKTLSSELVRLHLHPDCILTGASDQRTRIGLLGMVAAAGWRAGFTQIPALYHRALTVDRSISLIDNNLRLMQLLNLETQHREPRVPFSLTDAGHAEGLVRGMDAGRRPLLMMVTQTSGGQLTGGTLIASSVSSATPTTSLSVRFPMSEQPGMRRRSRRSGLRQGKSASRSREERPLLSLPRCWR